MHTERMRGVIFEHDFDGVAYLGTENGPKDPQISIVGVALFQGCEGAVGVFAVDGLLVDAPDAMRSRLGVSLLQVIEGMAHGFISSRRGIVPSNFVGGNIIDASFSRGGLRKKWMTREKKKKETKSALQGRGATASSHRILPAVES